MADYWSWWFSEITSNFFLNILLCLSVCASLIAFIYNRNNLYAWMCIALRDKLLKDTIRWFVKWQTVMSWLNRIIIFEADLMLRFIHTLFSQCFYHEMIYILNILWFNSKQIDFNFYLNYHWAQMKDFISSCQILSKKFKLTTKTLN